MTIVVSTPDVDGLDAVLAALRDWQREGSLLQLHPGDIGWYWRSGAEQTAATVRTWSRDGRILAVGLLDESDLLRLTIDPDARGDEELARGIADDIDDPDRGVLGKGEVYLEVPGDALVRDVLAEKGWHDDDPWTPLRRDLSAPVEDSGLRVEVVGPELVAVRAAVQRSAFNSTHFTEERWHDMASGPAYADARCLVGFDDEDNAVAIVTVWSAGPGKPGILEPMGVHADHRGKGHGRAMNIAAAAALRDMGASSAMVATPSSNTGAVAAYRSAGFEEMPQRFDKRRDA
ncbi:MAG TPA: GNAT family N-acetyltransferase [Phytomonospora sp.]